MDLKIQDSTIERWKKPVYTSLDSLKWEFPKPIFEKWLDDDENVQGGFLPGLREWLFDPFHWDRCCSPSFPRFFFDLKENVKKFLTPHYRLRQAFLECFANLNGGKLLNSGSDFVHLRTRGPECLYFTLIFDTFHWRLIRSQLLNENGDPCNAFFESFRFLDDDEKDEDEDLKSKYREVKETISSGWLFSKGDLKSQLNEISSLTPDLDWFVDQIPSI